MKKLIFILLWMLSGSCSDSTSDSLTTQIIYIQSGAVGLGEAAYGINPLHVAIGTRIVWQNDDNMTHTATSDTGIWDTGNIPSGGLSGSVTFNIEGSFPYHCTLHGAGSMSGVIMIP